MTSTPPAGGAGGGDPADAARKLEAYFIRRMLAEVRATPQAGSLDGGYGAQMFREMFDEALADKMAEAGGIGVASMVEAQLGGERPELVAPSRLRTAYGGHGAPAIAAAAHAPAPGAMAPIGAPAAGELSVVPVAVPANPTSGFGLRRDPIERSEHRRHNGVDLAAAAGTPVQAAGAGRVTHAGPAGTYGNLIVVDHGDGLETRYAHLASTSVHVGDRIDAGAVVGAVGSTGRSTGPHLHFEVRREGKPVDPGDRLPGLKVVQNGSNR